VVSFWVISLSEENFNSCLGKSCFFLTGFDFNCNFFNIVGPRKTSAKNIPDKETKVFFHVPGMPRKGSMATQTPNEMKKLFLCMRILYLIPPLPQIVYSHQKSGTDKY
jgi:hypothetical protein